MRTETFGYDGGDAPAPLAGSNGALTQVERTFGNMHDLLSLMDTVVSSLAGEPGPKASHGGKEVAGFSFAGQLGAVAQQADNLNDRISYARDRLEFLARSAA